MSPTPHKLTDRLPHRQMIDVNATEFTTIPCELTERASTPEHIVVVPPQADLARGFVRAHDLIRSGVSVRLVGVGVTFPRLWPSWTMRLPGLWLSELGSYRRGTRMDSTASLRDAIRRWCAYVFSDLLPGLEGSRAFYGSAGTRLFIPFLNAKIFVDGLASEHGLATIECTDETWHGFPLLRDLVRARGGTVVSEQHKAQVLAVWPVVAGTLGAAVWIATIVDLMRGFHRAHPVLVDVQRRRVNTTSSSPTVWVALIADWYRANHHLLESLDLEAMNRSGRLGVLAYGTLSRGMRVESNLRAREGRELWLGFGRLTQFLINVLSIKSFARNPPLTYFVLLFS